MLAECNTGGRSMKCRTYSIPSLETAGIQLALDDRGSCTPFRQLVREAQDATHPGVKSQAGKARKLANIRYIVPIEPPAVACLTGADELGSRYARAVRISMRDHIPRRVAATASPKRDVKGRRSTRSVCSLEPASRFLDSSGSVGPVWATSSELTASSPDYHLSGEQEDQ